MKNFQFINKWHIAVAIGLLLIMFVIEFTSANLESQTYDEGMHITAGYQHLMDKKIILNPEHPPLIKLLSAIFIAPLKPNLPNMGDLPQLEYSRKFMQQSGNNVDKILLYGRLPIMLLSILMGWIIFVWAKQLAGIKAGLFALILYVFDPNILAHSRYITTDIGVSLAFLATFYFFYRYSIHKSIYNLLSLAIVFSLAQLTKFSTLMLAPLIFGFALFAKLKIKKYLLLILLCCLFTFLLIIIFYCGDLNTYKFGLEKLQNHEQVGHVAYLLGNISQFGFWYYFPLTFIFKTPLLTIVLLILAIIIFLRKFFSKLALINKKQNIIKKISAAIKIITLAEWMIIIFPIFYMVVSMINHINIGVRHILPIYPFIFIFIAINIFGNNFNPWHNKIKILSICLIFLYAINSLLVYPEYLSYFSRIIGNSSNGYKYLLDSNVDWGQNLKKLKKYLDDNNIKDPIVLCYFGTGDPNYYKINNLPMEGQKKGWIAISIQHIIMLPKYQWFLSYEPIAKIGNGIYLYKL